MKTTETLAAHGRTLSEINIDLTDLVGVLAEWRSQTTELPDGTPWDWSLKDLAGVIKERAAE